jgi:glycosyltransferase-like protein
MPLRIGLFTHSTNPRGGVVHCLELAEALADLGHDVTVHAPAEAGRGFFRPPRRARHALIPAAAVIGDLRNLVWQRVGEHAAHLASHSRSFDVHHAHDGITGNALADLGVRFVRTVHHLDPFADPWLAAAQDRSVTAAAAHLVVGRLWQTELRDRYGLTAALVPSGVDTKRFSPGPVNVALRRRWVGDRSPVFLAVGGVERRKNTVNLLRAFHRVRRSLPNAALLVVGGATLLDHSAYRRDFDALDATGVTVTGPVSDDEMAAAYRLADALAFPSVVEGFGLAVVEAMASGTPVVTSDIAPFTEYLRDGEALRVDPLDVAALADALVRATDPATAADLRAAGLAAVPRFGWPAAAAAHVAAYRELLLTGDHSHARDDVPRALAR